MAGYRSRLEADLDRWIAEGLVPAENREALLAGVAAPRRLDAATALAFVGLALLGMAVIALTASNWDGLPRVARFALLVCVFLAAVGGAAGASARGWSGARNGLLTLAALLFAAAVGLTGQIFDIAGDPRTALYSSGLAAGLLAVAGRSTGAATAALVLIGAGDLQEAVTGGTTWSLLAAPAALGLAWAWRSAPMAQAGSIALIAALARFTFTMAEAETVGLLLSAAFVPLAFGARWVAQREEGLTAAIFYGWTVWGVLGFFASAGSGEVFGGLPHRLAWLALGVAAVALGRHDRHGMVTAGGVVALCGAVAAILFDLGMGLLTAAGLFAVSAVLALAAGWVLRRRQAA